ncbi:transcription factor [Geotalea uraniireducens]|uniref:Transcription factor n=1 Tax=Geotalea uraniireducens TaxID=351604 RepID=A0ABM8ENC0_9BACT|nr:IPT/TIG domain-containing protein [Geotalea uraniireducens]BDV43525.1 transcription factor [Geotalea uraniireducens]
MKTIILMSLLALAIALPVGAAPTNGAGKQMKPLKKTIEKPPATEPLNILSIIPAQGEPNITVTLSGTGFTGKTAAFLGTNEIPTTVQGNEVLTFVIPKLAPGLYALFLKREDGTVSRTYNFSIFAPKPFIDGVSPDTVDICSATGERAITISGRNFQPGCQVLFNGAVVKSSYNSEESISFSVPPAPGGLHKVQVKNPDESITTPVTLAITATPEISSVSIGESSVNYYKLIIDGKNFQPGSTIAVDERYFQAGLNAGAAKRLTAGNPSTGEREMLMYVSCSELVYQRYPADPTDKDLRLQVINPNGEASSVVQVTAP